LHSDVLIPELPESCEFAEIADVYVKNGQHVDAGDSLFDVETEKVILEVLADQTGTIESIQVSKGEHVTVNQVAMSLKITETSTIPTQKKEVEYIERVTEKLVKDDSGRVLLEEVVGNSLFDKRGLICGMAGLILGLVFGILGTAIVIG